MDLTYTDAVWEDLGVAPCEGDFDLSSEGDFSLTWPSSLPLPALGSLVYAEGTDVGGVVRGYDTTGDSVRVTGSTWPGILASRVVGPDAGQAYLVAKGDLSAVLRSLVARVGLSGPVAVPETPSGVPVDHTFTGSRDAAQEGSGRYMSLWAAAWQLCLEAGGSLRGRWEGGHPARLRLAAVRSTDWSADEEVPTSAALVRVRSGTPTNHLVCLGQGEGAAREVLHLYADASGVVSRVQSLTGLSEVAEVYDYSSSKDLEADGRKRLARFRQEAQEVRVTIPEGCGISFDLGDVVGGTDPSTGISARAVVARKRVDVPSGAATYETIVR